MSGLSKRDFRLQEHKDFFEALRSANPSHSIDFYRLFEDFLVLSSCAIAQPAFKLLTGSIDADIEKEYLETAKRYNSDALVKFAKAQSVLVEGLQRETHDFLGEVAGSAGVLNHWAGQFFTPWPLAQMMARMTLGDDPLGDRKRLTIQEPAVGGGAMLLAIAADLRAKNVHQWRWWFDATDIDLRCFRMAYIQLSLCGCPGVVRHGNTISLEQWRAWPTIVGAMFPYRHEPGAEQQPSAISEPTQLELLP